MATTDAAASQPYNDVFDWRTVCTPTIRTVRPAVVACRLESVESAPDPEGPFRKGKTCTSDLRIEPAR